mmetsp:Transcript_3591/g.10335  ORF Transcript_3591/g.10335 Transcript_3591/m.10335 type:complete len:217 (+) Transcript_3591:1433-2083(+)
MFLPFSPAFAHVVLLRDEAQTVGRLRGPLERQLPSAGPKLELLQHAVHGFPAAPGQALGALPRLLLREISPCRPLKQLCNVVAPALGEPPVRPRGTAQSLVEVELNLLLTDPVPATVLCCGQEGKALRDDLYQDAHQLPHLVHGAAARASTPAAALGAQEVQRQVLAVAAHGGKGCGVRPGALLLVHEGDRVRGDHWHHRYARQQDSGGMALVGLL